MNITVTCLDAIISLLEKMKKYATTTVMVVIIGIAILALGFEKGKLADAVIYLATIIACAFIVECVAISRPTKKEWPVKNGKNETRVVVFCLVIFALTLSLKFIVIKDFSLANPILKIAMLVGLVLFIYPIFLIYYFFIRKKYKVHEIGIRLANSWIAIPLIAIVGTVTYLFFPEKMQFVSIYEQAGPLSFLTLGFLTAAIPEELTRTLAQTRWSVFLGKGQGWLLASVIWGLLHFPRFQTDATYFEACKEILKILPLGLLWGFTTERLKNMIPAILIHGTNLWGIQDF